MPSRHLHSSAIFQGLPLLQKFAVLSLSPITRDRRVLRQCELIASHFELCCVIGYGSKDDKLVWHFERFPVPQPTLGHRISTILRQAPARTGTWAARLGFWAAQRHRFALDALKRHDPDIVVANDWHALVIAAAYKKNRPCKVHFDSHEFATQEFEEHRWWRWIYQPFVMALEKDAIKAADSCSTVGPRLATALQELYGLAKLPSVIRNVADKIDIPDRPTHWPLHVLYHGYVLPNRGIEETIDSVASWETPHRLIIRGDGSPSYIADLKQRAVTMGHSEQITFEPGVALNEVLQAATSSDLGIFFTPLGSPQRAFTLPNKLFEYLAAGLAVAISPGPDMQDIVFQYGAGIVTESPSAASIAKAINVLTRESVDEYRKASRSAATHLCWEEEQLGLKLILERLACGTRSA
jgi:glycogen synthase